MLELLNDRTKYLSSIDNFNTRDLTRKALIYWDGYLSVNKLIESDYILLLKSMGQDPNFYLNLNLFVQHLINNGKHPRTIRAYFSAVKQYLRNQGLRIYNEDIKQFVKFPKVLKEPFVNIRAETAKMGVERKTFFSKQVWIILNLLKSQTQSDDYVFCSNYEPKKSLDELESKFALLRNRSKLSKKYNNSNVNTITIHRFRAFCKTQASEICGKDYAEGLIGHEGYLGGYYGLSDEENLKNYLKVEPKLIFKI